MNVIQILDDAAARFPGETAIAWGQPGRERTVSFRDLAERSQRLAGLFRNAGLRPGDGVVVFLPMSGPLYEVMAAVLRLGLVPVFLDPTAWRDALARAAASIPLRAFVGTPRACFFRWFIPALRRIPQAFVAGSAMPGATSLDNAVRTAPIAQIEACPEEATALLTFTSGSTGRPKGVLRTHGMLAATHRILSRHFSLEPGEAQLVVLPFFVFANLGAGATSVIPHFDPRSPAMADPATVVRQILAWNVRGIVASPFLTRRIAEFCDRHGRKLVPLRNVFAGGAPVVPAVLDAAAVIAPEARIAAVYGATEAEPIALADRADFGSRERESIAKGFGLLAGRPIDEISMRILVDCWGRARGPYSASEFEAAQAPGEMQGEIVVAGSHVSPGYLGGEGDHEHKIVANGVVWHRTGDAGHLDGTGRLWLAGRCAGKIPGDPQTLYPLQVEAALSELPNISYATFVTRAARRVLVIQPAREFGSLDIGDVISRIAWCHPDEIVVMKRIPMDRRHNAKVNYPELQAQIERGESLARVPVPAPVVP